MGCTPWGKLTIDCGEGRKYPLVYASKMHGIGIGLHTCLLIKNQRNQCLELTQVLLGGNSMTNNTLSIKHSILELTLHLMCYILGIAMSILGCLIGILMLSNWHWNALHIVAVVLLVSWNVLLLNFLFGNKA